LDGELVLITRSRFSLRQDLNVISFVKPAERRRRRLKPTTIRGHAGSSVPMEAAQTLRTVPIIAPGRGNAPASRARALN
jgi:hypothetical protein